MSKATTQDRLAAKTPEATFLHVLKKEFNFSLRVSRKVLSTARDVGRGSIVVGGAARPGAAGSDQPESAIRSTVG